MAILRCLIAAGVAGTLWAPVFPVNALRNAARAEPLDEAYTARIRELTQDPRIITELVDHLPASERVPTPLETLGRIPGTPGEVSSSAEIYRYFDALDAASDRVAVWRLGRTEEGRDLIAAAIGDAATLASLDQYKRYTAALTDPRTLPDAEARSLIATAKPVYYVTGGIHAPELGSPEMLMELAYRLAVGESPFIQAIRDNLIVLITPLLEVDGRDKQVDSWYFRKRTGRALPLVYWGKYVAHDNNRDGMGQALALTRHVMAAFLDWHPTVLHDLHESVPYLYTSTGTGPYNTALDPLVTDEWWMLAKYEISELTKRGVPGVWTWGFYDGWVPNYLFFIANSHNSIGRFYETQAYGPSNEEITLGPTQISREWFRPNPPLPTIKWGPRNNVNLQQSALLLAMSYVAKNREWFLENYWLKNKRAVERGRGEAPYAWIVPAAQRRRIEAAEMMNTLMRQGVEVHTADAPFAAGALAVAAGDYVVRMDQPYRTVVDMYFGVQRYAAANPSPYDDTGWTFQYLRNVQAMPVDDRAVLAQPMTRVHGDVRVAGTITGTGPVLLVEHTTDSALVTWRFMHRTVPMLAAEEPFDAGGRRFAAGTIVVPHADRARLAPSVASLGLSAVAVPSLPSVPTHSLDVPRIGLMHSWVRTQDEGWWRLAFDRLGVPYEYFADQKLREGGLRERYDVIVYPHVGGPLASHVNGVTADGPLPYRKTPETPHLGVLDRSDDIRGGMGLEGLAHLVRFVEEGGTLLAEGSTVELLSAYGIARSVAVEQPTDLVVRGAVLKAVFGDRASPIAYGFAAPELPVYFSRGPVVAAAGAPVTGPERDAGGAAAGVGMNLTPNAEPPAVARLDARAADGERPSAADVDRFRQTATTLGVSLGERPPRVVLGFPEDPDDILLSGLLAGGQALAGRAVVIHVPLGKGHLVMFTNRPFWRWQTQGSFFLVFNALLNWNDLDRGSSPRGASQAESTPAASVR
jgi:hypothetical protein